jgi:O-antigen ligase
MRRDTHNLGLELMTSTGLVGTIPFLIGMGLCVLAAWRARRGEQGVLPMAMIALVLVGNLSGNFLVFKLYWVMLAFAVASAATWKAQAGASAGSAGIRQKFPPVGRRRA